MPPELIVRFSEKVDTSGECWLWTGSRSPTGYGNVKVRGHSLLAHRLAYMLLQGPIPEGLTLDHLCRVRHCVNPYHLEPVTQRENNRRGIGPAAVNAARQSCVNGHSLTDAYLYRGHRLCRRCRVETTRRWRERRNTA